MLIREERGLKKEKSRKSLVNGRKRSRKRMKKKGSEIAWEVYGRDLLLAERKMEGLEGKGKVGGKGNGD